MKTNPRESILKENPDCIPEYWTAIKVLKNLHRKYGEKLLQNEVITIIQNESPVTYELIRMLTETKQYNKHAIQTLYHIIQDIKEHYDPTVEIIAPQSIKQESLAHTYKVVNRTVTTQTGITIKTQGKIYKREADTDIEKLLQ